MGKALQEYLDIRFNKRKQEGDEGESHKSLESSALYNVSSAFPEGAVVYTVFAGGATFISARAQQRRVMRTCVGRRKLH